MNKERRKQIELVKSDYEAAINDHLSLLKTAVEEVRDSLDSVKGEEEEAFERLLPSAQGSERGEKMQAAIDALNDAVDKLNELLTALDDVDGVAELLDTAME